MVAYSDIYQGIFEGQFKTDLALPFWSVGFSMDTRRRNFFHSKISQLFSICHFVLWLPQIGEKSRHKMVQMENSMPLKMGGEATIPALKVIISILGLLFISTFPADVPFVPGKERPQPCDPCFRLTSQKCQVFVDSRQMRNVSTVLRDLLDLTSHLKTVLQINMSESSWQTNNLSRASKC